MILIINTTKNNCLEIGLKENGKCPLLLEQPANRDQAEKLLPMIEKMLNKQNFTLSALTKIVVNNGQGSFTSLRIGISTANALGYALNIPVEDNKGESKHIKNISIVIPKYASDPDITKPKIKLKNKNY